MRHHKTVHYFHQDWLISLPPAMYFLDLQQVILYLVMTAPGVTFVVHVYVEIECMQCILQCM